MIYYYSKLYYWSTLHSTICYISWHMWVDEKIRKRIQCSIDFRHWKDRGFHGITDWKLGGHSNPLRFKCDVLQMRHALCWFDTGRSYQRLSLRTLKPNFSRYTKPYYRSIVPLSLVTLRRHWSIRQVIKWDTGNKQVILYNFHSSNFMHAHFLT